MGNEVTKSKVISSLIWKLLERGGTQGIQLFVMILLARLLLPAEFGLIVLVSIFITIAGVLVQSGFNTALIQNKNVDEFDLSSVFYLQLLVASILYLGLFFTAPLIETFFEQPYFKAVLRVLSLTLFLGAFNSIQYAVIAREMHFKKLFLSSISANLISGVVGVWMAYNAFGVWALVGHQLINQFIITIVLWFTVKWRPRLLFSKERIKHLFSFGWKLMVSALIDTLYMSLRNALVGKIYSPAMLGFYNRGDQFPNFLVSNINGSIQSVILPTLSSHQDDKQQVKGIVRRSIVTSAFIVCPMMAGLAVIAEPLVMILLTEKWLPTVPFLQIFCLVYALWPIHTTNLQAINAVGRSDIFLKIEVIKTLLGLIILGITIPLGVHVMAFGIFVGGILSTFINAFPNKKLLNYSMQEQWRDILPSLVISLIMGVAIYPIHWFGMSEISTILIQIVVGIILYIGLAQLFKLEGYTYLFMTLRKMVNREKGIPNRMEVHVEEDFIISDTVNSKSPSKL